MSDSRKPINHVLKCWPKYFQAMLDGAKNFEVRLADRDYQIGDTIENKEWDPEIRNFTGRTQPPREITFILKPGEMSLPLDICVISLRTLAAESAVKLLEAELKEAKKICPMCEDWRKEIKLLEAQAAVMRKALKFYADGEHFSGELFQLFETVSGEPENFVFGAVEKDQLPDSKPLVDFVNEAAIEIGTFAKQALSSSSGDAWLKRMEALEEVAKAAKSFWDNWETLAEKDGSVLGGDTSIPFEKMWEAIETLEVLKEE